MKLTKIIVALACIVLLSAACDIFGGQQAATAGVLRTANGGADWQFSNTIRDSELNLSGTNISWFKFKPGSSEVLYASSYNNGLFISEDGGQSWRQILSEFYAYDFVFDTFNSDTLYVAGTAGNRGRVLVTKDGGKSWQEIFSEGTLGNAVRTIATGAGQQLYIGLENGNIVLSNDAGMNWQLVENLETRINHIRLVGGTLYVLGQKKGLFRSTDNGQNFVNLTHPQGQDRDTSVFQGVGNYNQIYMSPVSIYLATNNGLYRSLDQGVSWTKLVLPLQDTDPNILTVAAAPLNDNIVYTAAGPTIYKSMDGGQSWQVQNSHTPARITAFLVHPENPQLVYAGAFQ